MSVASADLFEKVVVDMTPNRVTLEVEVDVHVLPEPARVIVAVRLCITERLQDAVRLKENILDPKTRTRRLEIESGSVKIVLYRIRPN